MYGSFYQNAVSLLMSFLISVCLNLVLFYLIGSIRTCTVQISASVGSNGVRQLQPYRTQYLTAGIELCNQRNQIFQSASLPDHLFSRVAPGLSKLSVMPNGETLIMGEFDTNGLFLIVVISS